MKYEIHAVNHKGENAVRTPYGNDSILITLARREELTRDDSLWHGPIEKDRRIFHLKIKNTETGKFLSY